MMKNYHLYVNVYYHHLNYIKLIKTTRAKSDSTKLNEYHESIQDDIVNELSELTSTLKSKAIEFSNKLLNQDSDILQQTHDNLSINRTMFDTLNKNLNDYLLNKTGWSISIWTLLKFAVALIVIFVVMLLFIIIVPRIR